MKRKQLLLYFLIPMYLSVFAQDSEKAEKLFNDRQYAEAGEIYRDLLKKSPKNALNNYRYARCCYESGKTRTAIKHFEMAGERYPLRNFYLGELYFSVYEFEKSIEAYNKYLPTLEENDEQISVLTKKLTQAEYANRLLARVEEIAVVDSMVVDKDDFLAYYRFSSELGTLKQERLNLAPAGAEDKISYITQRHDRMYFSDSVEGRMDIFTSFRLLDGWSKPASLSDEINSGGNENYPFLMPDGVTMYFASNGENSIGGYDIFITKYIPATNSYLAPENIGMPFNSPYNDYMMLIDEVNNRAWFATDRYLPEGKVAIYMFVPNESKKILQSEDEEYIRRAAQLKVFIQADSSCISKSVKTGKTESNDDNEMEFIITDKLVYTHTKQFKSAEALKAWKELNALETQQANMKSQLKTLRKEYASAKDAAELSIITPKILALEKKIQKQDELIYQKTLSARNKELNQISQISTH